MASSQIASMLDELMGRNRNFNPNDNVRELRWTDSDICRYFIVDFCPHDLFTNTRADLGACGNIHDEALRREFAAEKDNPRKLQAIDEFFRFCQRMLNDIEVRIRKAKERLMLTQNSSNDLADRLQGLTGEARENAERVHILGDKINDLVEKAEQCGFEGNVEEAQGLLKLCDELRDEKTKLERSIGLQGGPHSFREDYTMQKAMEVCDVCGAFLIIGDAQQRVDDHLLGKQHVGYARLREAVNKINNARQLSREAGHKRSLEDESKKDEEQHRHIRRRSSSRDRRSSDSRRYERDGRHRSSYERENDRNSRYDRGNRYDDRTSKDRRYRSRSRSGDRRGRHYRSSSRDRYTRERSRNGGRY